MKKKLTLMLALFVLFSNFLRADCPGAFDSPSCNDILTSVTFSLEKSNTGEGCEYYFLIDGIDPEYYNCLNIEVSFVPTDPALGDYPDVMQSNIPTHWNVTANHFTNDPVPYFVKISITWNDPQQFCLPSISHLFEGTMQCCQYDNDDIGIELSSDRIHCDVATGCREELILNFKNISPATIKWETYNADCPAPTIPDNTVSPIIDLIFCDSLYFISVEVTDEYGCTYYDAITIKCDGCSIFCPPLDPDIGPIEVVLTDCDYDPVTDKTNCVYTCTILNAPANGNFTWFSSAGIHHTNPITIPMTSTSTPVIGVAVVTDDDNCPMTTGLSFKVDPCPDGCTGTLDDGGNGGEYKFSATNNAGKHEELSMQVYPNPVKLSSSSRISLALSADLKTSATIEIFNTAGIKIKDFAIAKDWNQEIDLNGFSSGLYFIKISDGSKVLLVDKIIVLK